jgi:DNA-binding transcriptional regulator YiaG
LGLTQNELAKQLGVSIRTLKNWERGRTKPGKHLSDRIQFILNQVHLEDSLTARVLET